MKAFKIKKKLNALTPLGLKCSKGILASASDSWDRATVRPEGWEFQLLQCPEQTRPHKEQYLLYTDTVEGIAQSAVLVSGVLFWESGGI